MRYIPLLLVFFFLGIFGLEAQPMRESSYDQKMEYVDVLIQETDYYNAYDLLRELYDESQDYSLVRRLGWLQIKLRDYTRAEKTYSRILSKPDRYRPRSADTLRYAEVLRTNNKLEDARIVFENYMVYGQNDSLVKVATMGYESVLWLEKQEKAKDLFVDPLSQDINSGLTDMAPMLNDGVLYYATFNKNGKIVIDKDAKKTHMRIFAASRSEDGTYGKPDDLNKKINREDYHTSNPAFSKDGRIMYFTRSRLLGDSITSSTLYWSKYDKEEEEWSGPQEVIGLNGDYIITHPMVGELFGDDVLYFASNMMGGMGGYDIYYATIKSNAEFASPVNLGPSINSAKNDITPYYNEGTLYFSSDAHLGAGGFDVYSSDWDGTKWSELKNMGLPINSTYDDMFYRWDNENGQGYVVSNRPYDGKRTTKSESCCDDIFEVTKQAFEVNVMARVLDEDKKALNGATVSLYQMVNGEEVFLEKVTGTDINTFEFPLKVNKYYRVVVSHDTHESETYDFNTIGLTNDKTYERDFILKKMVIVQEESYDTITFNEEIRLGSIYYDFDDDKILPAAEPDLYFIKDIMTEYPNMKIELSSHTDARGKDSYNQALSQRRANSAKRWLIQHGVSPSRVIAKGYGEKNILNGCTNGVDCTEEQHQFNRRTQFKIIEGPQSIQVKKRVKSTGPSQGSISPPKTPVTPAAPVFDGDGSRATAAAESGTQEAKKKSTTAPETNRKVKEPKFKLLRKFHDFGVVQSGEEKYHVYEFMNSGDAVLMLERVTADPCIKLEWTQVPIMPGEMGEIRMIYQSINRQGEDELTLNIICNTEEQVHSARMRAFVQ